MTPYSFQMPERLVFLRTLCALAEGRAVLTAAPPDSDAACVITVLIDPQRRIVVLGGREGMPRSLGSVYGGSITRFLGGFRGCMSRVIAMPGVKSACNGIAVSHDGSALLVADYYGGTHAMHIFSVHTGAYLQTIGGFGSGPLQFSRPYQVWVASDGFVFVAECDNNRVQVLTPLYNFHSFVGVRQLFMPHGVCADDDVIVVSERYNHRLSVFNRNGGALRRRMGNFDSGDRYYLYRPTVLCFMSEHRHVAVVEDNARVSVYTLKGEFVRHVGFGNVVGVACSDTDELVVADPFNEHVTVFGASGQIVWRSKASAACGFKGVAVHGSMIFGQTGGDDKCVVFS